MPKIAGTSLIRTFRHMSNLMNKRYPVRFSVSTLFTVGMLIVCGFSPQSYVQAEGKEKVDPYVYKDKDLTFRIIRRSPKQIAAFYEGRGFSQHAISKITPTCYIAVIVKNKTQDVLWLELDQWQFENKQGSFMRFERSHWYKIWDEINLPMAHRSTFGWTLMPEVRDLRPDEGVGGNIPLPPQTDPIRITARFHTQANKQGQIKTVVMNNVMCLQDSDVK